MARNGALLTEIFINGQFLQFLISCVQLVVGCHLSRGPGQPVTAPGRSTWLVSSATLPPAQFVTVAILFLSSKQ